MTTTITPRIGLERVELKIKGDVELPRGRKWQRTVTSVAGNRFLIKSASCGLSGCYCDAEIVEVL